VSIKLEVCVDDAHGLAAAIAGGADRIELCAALGVGGLTPAPGLIARAAEAPIPVYAMIRPRAGSFVFEPGDIDVMRRDIEAVRKAGLAGVVLGASLPGGALDVATLALLLNDARGLGATLHRAIDLVPDMAEAVEQAIALGFERILTSGGARTALLGLDTLETAVEAAEDRIVIMPGSGIVPENAGDLLSRLPVTEIHASCSAPAPGDARSVAFGFEPATSRRTSEAVVRAFKAKLLG
jgi:copper homeostasis protein